MSKKQLCVKLIKLYPSGVPETMIFPVNTKRDVADGLTALVDNIQVAAIEDHDTSFMWLVELVEMTQQAIAALEERDDWGQ